MSEPFGTEAGEKDHAPEDMRRYKRVVKDVILNDPPLVLSEINKLMSRILENQDKLTDQVNKIAEVNIESAQGLSAVTKVFQAQLKGNIKEEDEEPKGDIYYAQ